MADPTTSNKLLAQPTRGSDVGVWDLPMNSNASALDGMFGGVTTIAVSSATSILLTVPSTGSVSAGAGPNQSQNALIKFTGTLTGPIGVTFTLPGFYIVHNQCVVGTTFIALIAGGGGNIIGAPPGRKCHVFYDGTNMDYVDMPEVGSFMDMAVAAIPVWMSTTVCSVVPWLPCDGSVLNVNNYTALGNLLGSTFGGNGITTFGVPDQRARYRIPLDNQGSQGAAGRVTAAVSGINGTTIGAAGGSQNLQAHTHTITDPGHAHTMSQNSKDGGGGVQFFYVDGTGAAGAALTAVATTNITVATTGSGASGAIPPGLVFGISFIKT
jgi:microcystin-dependent protein